MEVNSKDFWIKVREEVGNKLNKQNHLPYYRYECLLTIGW